MDRFNKIGIDASNIRTGGGVTHIARMLDFADPSASDIDEIIIWTSSHTALALPNKDWLTVKTPKWCNGGALIRFLGRQILLPILGKDENCNALFFPGGIIPLKSTIPTVAMSQNMLPFEPECAALFGIFSWMRLKMRLLRILQSYSFTHADGVIFLSNYAEEKITGTLKRISFSKAKIPHGVETRFFKFPESNELKIDKHSAFRFLYVSTILPYKHQIELMYAIAQLHESGCNVELCLVGSGNGWYSHKVRKIQGRLDPKGEFIHYEGNVPFQEIHSHYQNADAFVFASSCENLPNILIEAMASRMPIACSEKGPMPEVLGEAGIYFDPQDPKSIEMALRQIYLNSALRAELGNKALEKSKRYSWATCASNTLAFITQVADIKKKKI